MSKISGSEHTRAIWGDIKEGAAQVGANLKKIGRRKDAATSTKTAQASAPQLTTQKVVGKIEKGARKLKIAAYKGAIGIGKQVGVKAAKIAQLETKLHMVERQRYDAMSAKAKVNDVNARLRKFLAHKHVDGEELLTDAEQCCQQFDQWSVKQQQTFDKHITSLRHGMVNRRFSQALYDDHRDLIDQHAGVVKRSAPASAPQPENAAHGATPTPTAVRQATPSTDSTLGRATTAPRRPRTRAMHKEVNEVMVALNQLLERVDSNDQAIATLRAGLDVLNNKSLPMEDRVAIVSTFLKALKAVNSQEGLTTGQQQSLKAISKEVAQAKRVAARRYQAVQQPPSRPTNNRPPKT